MQMRRWGAGATALAVLVTPTAPTVHEGATALAASAGPGGAQGDATPGGPGGRGHAPLSTAVLPGADKLDETGRKPLIKRCIFRSYN